MTVPVLPAKTLEADLALSLRGVTKSYPRYERPADILLEALTGRKWHHERTVLQDITFNVGLGEVVGIIGANGAGKSTLLKLIARTLEPTSGSISAKGRIAAILELGTGFNPNYTGRENVIMSSVMRGVSESRARQNLQSIIAFSGLEDVIDDPFHTYSSGMQARLAFATAISVEADIIIIDEALAAGDARFTAKSLYRIRQISRSGVTCLFVSHVTYQIMQLCSRAIWIDEGRIRLDGPAIDVVRAYEYEMHRLIAGDRGEMQSDAEERRAPVESSSALPLVDGAVPAVSMTADAGALVHEATEFGHRGCISVDSNASLPAQSPVMAETSVGEYEAAYAHAQARPPGVPGSSEDTTKSTASLGNGSIPCAQATPPAIRSGHFSSGKYRITRLEMLDAQGHDSRTFRFGEPFCLRVAYECLLPEIPATSCGVAAAFTRMEDYEQVMYFNTNYPHSDQEMLNYHDAPFRQYRGRAGVVTAVIDFLQVRPGRYFVSVGILPNLQSHHEFYEYRHLVYQISVRANGFEEPSAFYPFVRWGNGPAT